MPPPFRADHIGSLLRPPSLLAAQRDSSSTASLYSNLFNTAAPSSTLTTAIASVAQEQLTRNVRPITSGEYSRLVFYSGIFETLSGFSTRTVDAVTAFRSRYPTVVVIAALSNTNSSNSSTPQPRSVAVATGKIHRDADRPAYGGEWAMLRASVPRALWGACKVTLPSPTYMHMQLRPGGAWDAGVYGGGDREYLADVARAYREEIAGLYAEGVRNVQVDDPNLTFFCDAGFVEGCAEDGVEVEELLDLYVWTHNEALKGRPGDLHVGVHLCRGNFKGSVHFVEGSYERIAQKLFNDLDYDTFYLEYDTERAGGLEPLRFVPKGKNVVLGVVSTKTPEMEDLDDLKRKVLDAADIIAKAQGRTREEALDDMGVSPQCGFSSAAPGGGIGVTTDVMWKKLELVQQLAKSIWG
jgi:methionine synthase II (cobalamin-independent)